MIELLAPHAAHKGLELAVFVHRDTSTLLRGDPARLWQILMNLVNNALKFTETGEVVLRVNTVWEEDGQVVVRFEIEDTGVGISEEQQARLFRPFSQLDGSSTRRHGGSGLGLVISRELVGLMGGKIGVVSEPGRGSTFWFTAKFEKRTDARPMETDLSGKTVLIVDDNLTNLRILKHQLEAWEMEVAVAHNAEEALTFLAKAHFDVAILDMQMPDMDGLQLTQHIRSSAALKEMRLILMTSVDQTQAQEHLKSLGLDANLRKPVTRTQLNNCLSRVLGRAAAESRPRSWKKHSFSTEQEHDTSKLDLSGVKVLLVEDNPINRRVTSLQMEKLGVKPDLASSGLQAVELFKKTRHDIILMDCQMPEMDGFETTREIRRLGEKLGQPVILALTANVMEGDRQNCIDAGMDDYLGKPLAFPQLSATLRKWTRSSR